MICVECTENEHGDHFFRTLKKHLTAKLESRFGKSWNDQIVKCRENLETMMASRNCEVEKLKQRMEEIEAELKVAQLQANVIDSYTKIIKNNDKSKEILSLLNLSNLGTLPTSYDSNLDKTESSAQNSAQFGKTTHSVSFLQGPSVFKPSKSVQTEAALLPPNSMLAAEQDVSVASCSSSNESPNSGRFHVYGFQNSFLPDNVVGPLPLDDENNEDELFDCENCVLKHVENPTWNFPICLRAVLRVYQRNPLIIDSSNFLGICPFYFQLRTELVQHKSKRNEKMVRIVMSCHVSSFVHDIPLVANFRYLFALVNEKGNDMSKVYEGIWSYPKHNELFWHAITYSELVNPNSGWIDENNDVRIAIELMRPA